MIFQPHLFPQCWLTYLPSQHPTAPLLHSSKSSNMLYFLPLLLEDYPTSAARLNRGHFLSHYSYYILFTTFTSYSEVGSLESSSEAWALMLGYIPGCNIYYLCDF